jgi:glycosyltransferase involved in cell wall biosynthesis
MRDQLIIGGISQTQIVVKPNFLARDPGVGQGGGRYALFSGRLSPEKGVEVLIAAWQKHRIQLPLLIAGAGPLSTIVATAAENSPHIVPVGFLEHERLLDLIGDASLMIVPSIGFEGFGLAVIEAFAKGTPVLASRLGAFPYMIKEGINGELFRSGDADDLAAKVTAMTSGQFVSTSMRSAARATYELSYSAERNYLALLDIYEAALDHAARKRRIAPSL